MPSRLTYAQSSTRIFIVPLAQELIPLLDIVSKGRRTDVTGLTTATSAAAATKKTLFLTQAYLIVLPHLLQEGSCKNRVARGVQGKSAGGGGGGVKWGVARDSTR